LLAFVAFIFGGLVNSFGVSVRYVLCGDELTPRGAVAKLYWHARGEGVRSAQHPPKKPDALTEYIWRKADERTR
jgi:hypothetical protein